MIEPRDEIKQLKAYKPPLDSRSDKYRYDFNENVLGASPKAIQALRDIDPIKLSTYPEYDTYYQRISKHFGVDADQIHLSNGTDEGIKLILETYMNAGDELVLPTPSFAMFNFYASRIGIDVKDVLYNDDLSFPTEKVINQITETTRMVVLVNPNNPTGTPILQEDIEEIVQKASHALVMIDEAYYDFAAANSLSLLDKYDNIIILRTFSKSIGLAGLRIGMAISRPETIAVLKKSSSPYNVSAIACTAAIAALDDTNFSRNYITRVKQSRERVAKQLSEWGYRVYASEANFLLIDFGKQNPWIIRFLRQRGILVRNRTDYPLLENCTRITMGDQDDTERLLNSIKEARETPPLIFDMDGVLVDVSESYRQAIAKTTEVYTGYLPSTHDIQQLKNEGGFNNDWKLSQELIAREGKEIDLDQVTETFQQFYLGTNGDSGLIEKEQWLLETAKLEDLYRSHPIYIYTGRPRAEAEFAIKTNQVGPFIDGLIAMDDTPADRGKPDPWGLNQFLEHFVADNAYYFGDTVDDMKAAVAAGIHAIGVLPPDQPESVETVLREAGASKIITIKQVQEVIL